jgi:shikimate kinase
VIAELTARHGIVLATGGGAVLSPASRQHLMTQGWVVYLETTVAQQAERATRTRNRPLLNGGDARQRLQELMAIREPLYREVADFALTTTRKRVHQVAEQIVFAYRAAHA